ncbi:kinetochore Sim4 complex subunit FTA2-domain-containing protein [Nemania sp. NC0429]|nr:kinetochore Sim4 complex subunit FTA2-domain-containing protein [Nemania sp. NC0429]
MASYIDNVNDLMLRQQPVPPCEGPKLQAFKYTSKEIEFIKLLSCDPRSEENDFTAGYVFEVRIDKKRFALKIFKFHDPIDTRIGWSTAWARRVTDETLTFHSDPFFAECRAYGRINQYYEDLDDKAGRRNGTSRPRLGNTKRRQLAVPCYGYITVSAEYETMLYEKFGVSEWYRSEAEETGEVPKDPFRALVKELVTSPISVLNPSRMVGDLKKLRKLGIYVRDIYARNYKAGFLVDFSIAWTAPHWCLIEISPFQRELFKNEELGMFDWMMKEEGIKTFVRARRNRKYCRKLRSSDKANSEASSV